MNPNRKPLFIANWKMHKTLAQVRAFFEEFNSGFSAGAKADAVICPPFTLLQSAVSLAAPPCAVGAQDVFWESEGAFTGEISAGMLLDLQCRYVIVGHSERRRLFGETNESVNRKMKACFKAGLVPVMCVGESLEERRSGEACRTVEKQVRQGLEGIALGDVGTPVLAYEPVWAIGTGKADTPEQSDETLGMIRETLEKLGGREFGQTARLLYGGSVKPDNIRGFMVMPQVDGALVGGAGLEAGSFLKIISQAFL